MNLLDLTMQSPAENLALDEALLDTAESKPSFTEVFRVWEPEQHFVVLGRSSPFATEVNHDYCHQNNIPVFRRSSGGASIVTGPGCLMYAVLLNYRQRPELRMLDVAHRFVMTQMKSAISRVGIDVQMLGTSDLTLGDQKISGNSLRCKRNWMLYHGTMLCQDFDMNMIYNCLGTPQRQPDYRQRRDHRTFLTKLSISTSNLKQAMLDEWQAVNEPTELPLELMQELIEKKYSKDSWNQKI